MPDGREEEIVNTIGEELLGLLPANADGITVEAEADDDYSSAILRLTRNDGTRYDFPADAYQQDPMDVVTEEIIQLRELTLADGRDPWYGVDITVYRDGRFEMKFSYDPPVYD